MRTQEYKDIKHAVIYTFDGLRYLCIYATGEPKPEKIAYNNIELTCKNCIKILQGQAERSGYEFNKR